MKLTDKIFVAGHTGLVGSAITRLLQKKGYHNILTVSSSELDLRNQYLVNKFFEKESSGVGNGGETVKRIYFQSIGREENNIVQTLMKKFN